MSIFKERIQLRIHLNDRGHSCMCVFQNAHLNLYLFYPNNLIIKIMFWYSN